MHLQRKKEGKRALWHIDALFYFQKAAQKFSVSHAWKLFHVFIHFFSLIRIHAPKLCLVPWSNPMIRVQISVEPKICQSCITFIIYTKQKYRQRVWNIIKLNVKDYTKKKKIYYFNYCTLIFLQETFHKKPVPFAEKSC